MRSVVVYSLVLFHFLAAQLAPAAYAAFSPDEPERSSADLTTNDLPSNSPCDDEDCTGTDAFITPPVFTPMPEQPFRFVPENDEAVPSSLSMEPSPRPPNL